MSWDEAKWTAKQIQKEIYSQVEGYEEGYDNGYSAGEINGRNQALAVDRAIKEVQMTQFNKDDYFDVVVSNTTCKAVGVFEGIDVSKYNAALIIVEGGRDYMALDGDKIGVFNLTEGYFEIHTCQNWGAAYSQTREEHQPYLKTTGDDRDYVYFIIVDNRLHCAMLSSYATISNIANVKATFY